MAMKIRNNESAGIALGKLKKKDKSLAAQIRKVSTGMRLNDAGDGTSDYVISERMRVRIRSLDQDTKNVQTGASLLRTAEGAIQQQIELLKTVKAKVIDADNDSNTDQDRATIQKEIKHAFDQIQDIANETTYNGKRLLLGGNALIEQVESWEVLDHAVLAPGSDDLGLIPDLYNRDPNVAADDTKYDRFTEWSNRSTTLPSLGLNETTNYLTGGSTVSTPKIMTLDLASCETSVLNNNDTGIGFYVTQGMRDFTSTTKKYFVLTQNPSATYSVVTGANSSTTATNVAVHSGMTKSAIAEAMASAINGAFGTSLIEAAADGEKVTITTKDAYTSITYANRCDAGGFQSTAGPVELYTYETVYTGRTNVFSTTNERLSGGQIEIRKTPSNPDAREQDAVANSITRNVAGVTSGTGIRITGNSAATLTFVDGSGGLSGGTIGKNYRGTARIAGLNISMDGNGNFTLSSDLDNASIQRNYYVRDGLSQSSERRVTGTVIVDDLKALTGSSVGGKVSSVPASDSQKIRATCKLDLSPYTGQTTREDLENLISSLKGKMLTWQYRYYETSTSRYSRQWEFIDTHGDISPTTGESRSIDAQSKQGSSVTLLDLNELRGLMAAGGGSVTDVMGSWMKSKLGDRAELDADGNVLFQAYLDGKAGNSDYLYVSEGTLRSYEIDLAAGLSGVSIPADLDGKGFRVYCATHRGQWFNFAFYNGMGSLDEKPDSGTDTQDIKTILIDVSQVRDANELAAAIYDQAMPILTSGDPYYDHYIRMGADTQNGKLTLYDSRRYNVNTSQFEYQIDGAKIADGIYDNVVKALRDVYGNDIVIHHTDRASQNLHLRIARTTLDHIFGKMPDTFDISKYHVMTAKSREKLLGNVAGRSRSGLQVADEEGLLDRGLTYLTNANAVIGAQISRLEMTENNVVTARENTQASESTYRDADMAKEMVEFTKANILAQSSQVMLAHANQEMGNVMGLLQ